ncbi:MAG: LacI family DNA-binding transcriptional regulator [Niabella sp.]
MSEQIPTIKEIARRLNVSISTVSRALNNHPRIGVQTRELVQNLAKELGYEPNPKAIFFKQKRSYVIGAVIPSISEDFFSRSISGIEEVAMAHGYTILFGQSHDSLEKEIQVIDAMRKQRVDGLLISLSKETNNYDHLKSLSKVKIPVVYFDRVPKVSNVHKIYCDITNGTAELVDWLIKQGHKRIALLNGPNEIVASKERLEGYIKGISKHKLKVDMQLVEQTDFSEASTFSALDKFLSHKRPPNAIISFNDYVHLDAVQWAVKNNIAVNKDILFASFANISLNKYTTYPPLVSIDQSPYKQGQNAVQMLLDILNAGDEFPADKFYHEKMPVELVHH